VFEASEAGKDKSALGATVTLRSLTGQDVTLHYRGASAHMLGVRGYGADGKLVPIESRQILPERRDVDQDFSIKFRSPAAKVEVVVAASVVEREFPFTLKKGATAGPPSSTTAGIKPPVAERAESVAAAAPAPAPAPKEPAPAPAAKEAAPATGKPAAAETPPTAVKSVVAPAAKEAAPAPPAPRKKPAAVAPEPAPAQPAPAVAASADDKPKAPRRAAPRKQAPVRAAEAPAPPTMRALKYNDLMSAVMARDAGAVEQLLKMGRWPDKTDRAGITPLMVAAQNGDARSAELLLKAGANPNLSVAGQTASSLAQQRGEFAMVDLLQRHGAR
jgi:hypothetical protein